MEQPVIEKKKSQRMPDARGYNIVDGYVETRVDKTKKEHTCFLCRNLISIGSKAMVYTEVANNKLLVNNRKYAHVTGEHLAIQE